MLAAVLALLFPVAACGSGDKDGNRDNTPRTESSGESSSDDNPGKVDPLEFNAGGLLGGNAAPNLPDGTAGEISVVQVGPLDADRSILLFAFRNNTADGVSHVDWTATARFDGSIVATGSSQGTEPAQLQPGEVGLGYIYFENAESIPAGSEYEFTADSSPVDTDSYNTAPLAVAEVNLVGSSFVGAATNGTGETAEGPFSVSFYCFDGDTITDFHSGFAEQDGPIDDGESVTFSVDLFDAQCPTYAVGVSGYFS